MRPCAAWVRDGTEPPPGVVPRVADGTLVAPDQVRLPAIPANSYGGTPRPAMSQARIFDTLHVLDFGPGYRAGDSSGVLVEPPKVGTGSYGVLVPQVDADGNDLAGIRSVFQQVPIGTYTGWNLFRAGRLEGGMCNLQGSFIPFAATAAERDAVGDPRLSLAERYPAKKNVWCRRVKPTFSRSLCLPPARTHFCELAARVYPRCSTPRKTSLN